MAKTYEELLEQAAIIRDETAAGKNTATRVGGTITDAVDYVKELQDTYKGIHAEAASAKQAAAAAKTTAAAAKTTAEEAKMNATAAMNTARSASLNATAANSTANDAKETAEQAVSTATSAQTAAETAQTTAAAAKTTAEEAKMNATAAMNTARSASLNATAANSTANDAKETAEQAVSTATSAQTAAETAQTTAAAAKTTAEEAKMNATAAMNTARSASLNATAANSTANEAKETADAAQEAANTAQQTADAAQTKNADQDTRIAALLQDIPWEGYHMNAFTETGEYHIHGESTDANDGLPILNSGTIDARLTVLDSSLTNGTGAKTDIVVTQILRLSNRMGGDGHVYVRTAQAATKSQLATPSSTAWGTWEKLIGMFEKNAVTNIADLDTYTTNGMYSGLFANTTFQTLGGLKFTPGDNFLLITVNGYAASAFGTPQLTQMLYKLPSKKGSGNSSARMYMRTAYWNKDADPKSWVFATWDRLAMASEISGGGGGGSIEEYNTLIELISANTTKISSVESTANGAKSAAETAQTAATAAQETANSAREAATAASTAAQEAKSAADNAQNAAENEATARTEADTELQSQINGKQDNIDSLSKDEKTAFLVSLGLGKIGVVSQKQTWNAVGVEPAYVMSEKVEGFISKDNIDSLISYGFAFNEGTGYFELNGLTDISLQEALNIVAAGKPNFSLCDLHYAYKNIRTNLPILDNVGYNVYFNNGVSNPIRIPYMASYSNIEVFVYYPYKIKNDYTTTGLKNSVISKCSLAFFACEKLEKIDVLPGTATDFFQSFIGCERLKELELVYLRCDVNLSPSAYLSAKSTHIMIANADNKKAITITLHPDAKARWEASEYYEEDSQTIISKNITIA